MEIDGTQHSMDKVRTLEIEVLVLDILGARIRARRIRVAALWHPTPLGTTRTAWSIIRFPGRVIQYIALSAGVSWPGSDCQPRPRPARARCPERRPAWHLDSDGQLACPSFRPCRLGSSLTGRLNFRRRPARRPARQAAA